MSNHQGYLYIASGEKYLAEAQFSVKSLKQTNPSAHATLITDRDFESTDFDVVKKIDADPAGNDWKKGLMFRLHGLQESPYEKTFYVDTDTFFCDSCDELFDLLAYYDLLLCPAPIGARLPTKNGSPIEGYYSYNAGVLVFNKNELVSALLVRWQQVFEEKFEEYAGSQPALMEAFLYIPIKTYALQSIYNFRIPFIVSANRAKVKIIHGRHKDLPLIAHKLNADISNRVWIPALEKVISARVKGWKARVKWLLR